MQAKDIHTEQGQPLLTDNSLKNNESLVLEMLEEIKKLLEKFPLARKFVNLEAPFKGNLPLLICATVSNLPIIVDQLLNYGANANAIGACHFTALHYAASDGFDIIVRTLLERGANICAINDYGDTPLHTAVINNHIETVTLLIVNGAPLDIRNNDGRTPLECATYYQRPHIETYIATIPQLTAAPRRLPNNNAAPHMANDSPFAPPPSLPPQNQTLQSNYSFMLQQRRV